MTKKLTLIVSAFFVSLTASAGDLGSALSLDQFGEVERSIPKYSELEYFGSQVGMYHGYRSEIKSINERLNRRAEQLDKLYNFRNLLIDNNMLPPVVIRAKQLYEQLDKDAFHESSVVYRIRKPSKLSYNSPTWRDYIYFDPSLFSKPMLPKDMRPKKREAKDVWEQAVTDGFERGKKHAQDVFSLFLAELNEDFNGMVMAHHLYELNMLNVSSLRKLNKGTIVTDKEININDRVVRLSPNDVFIEQDSWKPHLKIYREPVDE